MEDCAGEVEILHSLSKANIEQHSPVALLLKSCFCIQQYRKHVQGTLVRSDMFSECSSVTRVTRSDWSIWHFGSIRNGTSGALIKKVQKTDPPKFGYFKGLGHSKVFGLLFYVSSCSFPCKLKLRFSQERVLKTSQELRMLSCVTINRQVT